MHGMLVIDADGHVTESEKTLRKYLPKEYSARPLSSREAWDCSFGGALGKSNEDPQAH